MIAGVAITAVCYFVAIFADFLAPYDYREQSRREPSAPASKVDLKGGLPPTVYGNRLADPVMQRYETDESRSAKLEFFVRGFSYRILGVIASDVHLFGLSSDKPEGLRIQILGTDQLGRDRFSRLLYATRFSLIVSPIGTLLASLLGILIGIVSGYAGRKTDSVMMGVTDAVISLPTLVIILAARVAFPLELPAMTAALMMIAIFAFAGWAEMARLTRGLVRSTRELEFVTAARATGVGPLAILFRHILPNISRPLIAQATLTLPAFLLAESALSFLGVGLQEPEPSLGNMLSAANDMTQLGEHPFLILSPAIVIFIFVLGIRLISNGLKEKRSAL